MISAIVAVSPDWGIGCGDELLYRNSFDMGFFCGLTQGHAVVAGKRTADLIPNLPNRRLWILGKPAWELLSRDDEAVEEVVLELFGNAIVIGGGKTYKLFAPYVDQIYVTHFFNPPEKKADVFFPIEEYPWIIPENGVKIVSNKEFEIVLYRRDKDGI